MTTLLAFLVTFDLELNPEPTSPSGQAGTDFTCASDNSRPTEKCTTDQSTTLYHIFQSMQSLSSSINGMEKRLHSSGTPLAVTIQTLENILDAQLPKLYEKYETIFKDADSLFENY